MKTVRIPLFAAAVALCLLSAASSALCASAKTIVLVGSTDKVRAPSGRWLALVYAEAFRRLGYAVRLEGYPSARAVALADSGQADGELYRAYDYAKAHPGLVRVDEPIGDATYAAFAARPGLALDGWRSLRGTGYNVEFRTGVPKPETELRRVVRPERLSSVSRVDQGLKKLIKGRADIYVDAEDIVVAHLKGWNEAGFDATAVYRAGIMEKASMHTFLLRRHRALAAKLSQVLKQMKQEGLFEKYRDAVPGAP